MLITETKTVTIEKEIYVAPCLKCGSTDIQIFDYGYWQGNSGGGKCKSCGNTSTDRCCYDITTKNKIKIWNSFNDIETLIKTEEAKILESKTKIKELKQKKIVKNKSFKIKTTNN